jgi:hypothetical protein
MNHTKAEGLKKKGIWVLILFFWIIAAWLLYPLINLDTVQMENAKEYLYRSAFGIALLLIFFGKTIFDLLFPQVTMAKMPLMNTILLTLYALVLASGIIFMVLRMIVLYLKSRETGFLF